MTTLDLAWKFWDRGTHVRVCRAGRDDATGFVTQVESAGHHAVRVTLQRIGRPTPRPQTVLVTADDRIVRA